MISDVSAKRKFKADAVWLWCIGEGYEETENNEQFLDATFSKDKELTGFIFGFDKTVNEMLFCIEKAKEIVQYVYIVIDDDSKYRALEKIVPEYCGIFCNSNGFGLGQLIRIFRFPVCVDPYNGNS